MSIKFTHAKQHSLRLARKGKDKIRKGIDGLDKKDKIQHDIDVLKSQIKNVQHDIKQLGESSIYQRKLEVLNERLERLEDDENKE